MHWQLRRSTSKCPQLWRPRLHIIRWRAAAREHHIKINYWYIITTLVHLNTNLCSTRLSSLLRADEVACIDIRVCEILHVRDYLLVRGVSVLLLLLYGTCFNQYVVVVVYLTACGVHKNIIISMHAWDRGRAWIRTTCKVRILLLGLINNWYRSNNQLGEGLCEVSAILLCVVWWISL